MPFGLTNAPASFQNMINHVLREHLDVFVVVYLDDILIYSKTMEEHKQHVRIVLQALKEAGLNVSPKKSVFHTQRVDFLGYTITPNEIMMQEEKVMAVKDWPAPTDVRGIRAFLGFLNFYRRFIKGFGEIARPLTELTKKGKPFEWTNECERAFTILKEKILSQPILWHPQPERQFEVEADASDFAIGGQLGQRDDEGRLHPVAFFSKKLNGPELNYQVHDKELMAIVEAFKEWRHYLSGANHKVIVYTDHKNLTYFTTSKELNKRQTRWAEQLAEFNFRIKYKKGSENGRADALSRRPDHDQPVPPDTQTILTWEQGDLRPGQRTIMVGERLDTTPHEKMIIQANHDHAAAGHQGVGKTVKRIQRNHQIPGIWRKVSEYIQNCPQCAKNKTLRHKPYGMLQALPVAQRAWSSISWDFITKLPPSQEPMTKIKYDSIFVIVDRLTKYAYFLPYQESSTAADLAYTFLRTVLANHGAPEEIISDRDKLFTSKFWQALTEQLGVNHKLSTAHHARTDGQTERTNQTLEQYLRNYVNHDQDDWVKWLPTAQFAYNSADSEATKVSPFFANYGFNPELSRPADEPTDNPAAAVEATKLTELHQWLRKNLEEARKTMAQYFDKSKVEGPTLKEGDKVYLLNKNLRTDRPSKKLDHKRIGPFLVKAKISTSNYELALPKGMKVHPVFHISLLEPAPADAKVDESAQARMEEEREYVAERIVASRKRGRGVQYLVKWEGYDESENTWEPPKHLRKCQQLLREFHQTKQDQEALPRSQPNLPPPPRPQQAERPRPQRILPPRRARARQENPGHA